MLFMVIESFSDVTLQLVGERFKREGRMLPNGVHYQTSWMSEDGAQCFQVMEAETRHALDAWVGRWNDLVNFEVVPILTSEEFWSEKKS